MISVQFLLDLNELNENFHAENEGLRIQNKCNELTSIADSLFANVTVAPFMNFTTFL